MTIRHSLATVALITVGGPALLGAQWTNRYPKIAGMSHHVYLEGFELPLLTIGPIDPAVSPDGTRLAFASRGWLWTMDLASGAATRITMGGGIDSRPAWRPDGRALAFVRDNTRETSIVERDLASGRERVLAAEVGIELDPSYTADGRTLYYSSAVAGDLDIWTIDLTSGTKSRVTTTTGQELQPIPLPDGKRILYIAKGTGDDLRLRTLDSGEERTLLSGPILSMLRMALGPDGRTVALTWPGSDEQSWELRLIAIDGSPYSIKLAGGMPLTPAWAPDGKSVYFAEADDAQRMRLYRMPADGGPRSPVVVQSWNWGAPMGQLRIDTKLIGAGAAAARLHVADANGHPLLPDEGQPRFDGQNGLAFFYSEGSVLISAPVGQVSVKAVQGLATPTAEASARIEPAGGTVELTLAPVWDARANGWMSGDHHFHLNYGGPYWLEPNVLEPMARAEALDVLTPLLANLHTRFEDQGRFAWRSTAKLPFIAWGQEVRSHFLGHLGLVGTDELFWPWIWGPGYQVHGRDDRANQEVLAHTRRQGGISSYVHPIAVPDPFSEAGMARIPVEMVADGILGEFDTIELACLWSNEIGSMAMWYRLLNFGSVITPSAGTDVMNNFYRTMAVGTTRVYVKSDPALGYRGYLAGLKSGRSFVTTGPMLDLIIQGQGPGEILTRTKREVAWALDLHSAVGVDSVQIVVNGAVVATHAGINAPGSKHYEGRIKLPAGGWVAARALGGTTTSWPAMDSYAFAHTAPIWIGERGSTTPATKQAAAADLKRALEVSLGRLRTAYQGTPIPNLEGQFARALQRVSPFSPL